MTVQRVLYTSVFGGFEAIWPPLDHTPGLEHIAICDTEKVPVGWSSAEGQWTDAESPRLSNRRQKMLFHESLGGCISSLYVDANVRPVADLSDLFRRFEASGADLAMYPHYARASVRSEAQACLARNKVEHPERVPEELAYYEEAGFPDTAGMWEGSVIFKNQRSQRLEAAMREWWELYSRFETRDQFSLPFVIWKHGLSVLNLDQQPLGRDHYFVRLQHSSAGLGNRLARYLQARASENRLWSAAHGLGRSLKRSG